MKIYKVKYDYILACTANTRISDTIWSAVDKDGTMRWYKEEPKLEAGIWSGMLVGSLDRRKSK
jgi:hypothetical protein